MKNLLYLFLIGAAVVTACKGPQGDIGPQGPIGSQGSAGPQGVAGPNHRGDLMGFAQLLNEDGLIPTGVTDFSSVSVTAGKSRPGKSDSMRCRNAGLIASVSVNVP